MKRTFSLSLCAVLICISCCFSSKAHATIDTIKFGGSLGTVFQPASVNVKVGDTIRWIGFFGSSSPFHELQSLTIPTAAAAFGPINTGTSFDYVVTVAGKYNYQCNVHAAMGMVGDFTASTASVNTTTSSDMTLEQSYPNPSDGMTVIKYSLKHPSEVLLSVSDIDGKLVKKLVNKNQDAGNYEINFDASSLSNGTYEYQLKADNAVLTRQMIVLKK